MDIAMPRMDGLTAARRLRKTCPSVQVVMLTGSDVVADQNRARRGRRALLPQGRSRRASPTRSAARGGLGQPVLERLERRPARVGGSSSCSCGSSFRFAPQVGQSPAQSARQRICSGSASTTASRAHADGRAGRPRGTASAARRCPGWSPGTRGTSIGTSRTASASSGSRGRGAACPEAQAEGRSGRRAVDGELGRHLVGTGR